jgi:transcriptional regulator with GAF, ATPase, and Fis domain
MINASQNTQDLRPKTIHENERDYIMSVLKKCNGKIWGAGGAAELLNVPPSTLKSKMKKLGIPKDNY